jgi:lysophospholipase L1-like esterase
MSHMRTHRQRFFHLAGNSPIRRIVLTAVALGAAAACSKLGIGDKNPLAPTPPVAGSTIVYTAVGASDVSGVGSSVPCILFATEVSCENGMGYVPVTVRLLKAQGFTVNHLNLGLPTSVIGRDFQTLGQQYNRFIAGNFIDQEMPFIQANATVVTIFAGINEVNTVTSALGGGAGGTDPNGYMDAQVRAFGADYATLIAGIKARAGLARIVALNVPNPAGLPYLAGTTLAQRQAAQRIAVGMTRTVVNALTAQNVTVVDLMCDARSYVASNYYSDGLHPNDAGYAFIAAEVVKAITGSSYPAPQASCSGMTIVP